jgi:hypothetical protein
MNAPKTGREREGRGGETRCVYTYMRERRKGGHDIHKHPRMLCLLYSLQHLLLTISEENQNDLEEEGDGFCLSIHLPACLPVCFISSCGVDSRGEQRALYPKQAKPSKQETPGLSTLQEAPFPFPPPAHLISSHLISQSASRLLNSNTAPSARPGSRRRRYPRHGRFLRDAAASMGSPGGGSLARRR